MLHRPIRPFDFPFMFEVGNVPPTPYALPVDPETARPSLEDQAQVTVDALCAAAEKRAQQFGHRLGDWEDVGEEGYVARRAACSVCGALAYVRIEDGLYGVAGEAISQQCAGS